MKDLGCTLHCHWLKPIDRGEIGVAIREYMDAGGGPLGLAKLNFPEQFAPARGRRSDGAAPAEERILADCAPEALQPRAARGVEEPAVEPLLP